MRYHASAPALLLACLLTPVLPRPAAAGTEQDQFEEKTIARSAERATRVLKTDRAMWMKELEVAFPGKVADANTRDEYAAWFGLLAGEASEWRKAGSPTPGMTRLFDRVAERLRLGPVPSITRDEFDRYTRGVLMREDRRAQKDTPDPAEDAEDVFRVLDRNGDGILESGEMTTRLRADGLRADTDANGRIDKDEYRRYFTRRVTVAVETAAAKVGNESAKGALKGDDGEKDGANLPEWFADADADADGQIALYEWRRSGRSIESFEEMDLNADGLLTPDEYLRYARMKEKEGQTLPPG